MARCTSPSGAFIDELEILQPINPSTARTEDDYEVYKLTNVTVYSQPTSPTMQPCIANLLHAFSDNLLRVTGRLESVSRDQRKYLKTKPFRPVDISITDVYKFSCGESNGAVTVWALGRAGWFEISPSPAYSDMFRHMEEAMHILWFVLDLYTEGDTLRLKKKVGALSAQLVFQEYAEDKRFRAASVDDAKMVFVRHREFLIMLWCQRFLKVAWGKTPLVQWFKKEFPRDFEAAKARLEGRPVALEKFAPSTTVRSRTREPEPPTHRSTRHSKPSSWSALPQLPPKKDANWWTSTALFAFMQKVLNLGAIHPGHVTLDRLSRLLVRRYEIEDEEVARNVLTAHASNLRYLITKKSEKRNMRDLTSEPIYSELATDMHELSASDTRKALLVELRPRVDRKLLTRLVDSSSEEEEEDDSDIGIATPNRRLSRRSRGTLSVLRPKMSRLSGKGKAPKSSTMGKEKGRGKAPPPDIPSVEDSEDEEQVSEMDIDTPTHPAASSSPGKRQCGRLDVECDIERIAFVSRKRSASASFGADAVICGDTPNATAEQEEYAQEDSAAPSPPSSPSTSSETAHLSMTTPLDYRTNSSSHPCANRILPPIIQTSLPQYTANQPGDTWKCTFDGCRQRVYGASTELGRQLIETHVVDHANPLLGVVLREGGREGRGVSNLIKRIREMTEAQAPLFLPNSNSDIATRVT